MTVLSSACPAGLITLSMKRLLAAADCLVPDMSAGSTKGTESTMALLEIDSSSNITKFTELLLELFVAAPVAEY